MTSMHATDDSRIAVTDNLDLLLVCSRQTAARDGAAARPGRTARSGARSRAPARGTVPERTVTLSPEPITREDLDYMTARIGTFTRDNRAGIERTLHRISALRNRVGEIVV